MRVIDYYNIVAVVAFILIAIYASPGRSVAGERGRGRTYPVKAFRISILVVGVLLRIVWLASLPAGLQQDEASIGYEAFCLANYGVDRHGYAWPVYPITWGSGGGSPLMIYLNVLTTKLFGSHVTSIRLVPAICGILTLVMFYKMLKETLGERSATFGLALLAFSPWHIILSRWSLDSNTMPFCEVLMMLLFVKGALAEYRRLRWYVAGCIVAGVCLYDYGSATVIIPLFLVLYAIVLLVHSRISVKELLLSALAFVVTNLPIGYFYGVQYLGFPKVNLSWISFNRFTASHASAFVSFDRNLPRALANNALDIVRVLTIGVEGEDLWNAMPAYAALNKYMAPFLVIGLVVVVRISLNRQTTPATNPIDGHSAPENAMIAAYNRHITECVAADIFLCMFAAAFLFGLFIHVDINRMVMIFLPAIYLETIGLVWTIRCLRQRRGGLLLAYATIAMLFVGFFSFVKDYYGGYYNEYAESVFMPGYGEAMAYANALAENADSEDPAGQTMVYSTYTDVASPFMITLYYTKYDPYAFIETAEWKDEGAEFQVAKRFGRFVFGLPDERPEDAIYVVTESEAEEFDADYNKVPFGNFVVVNK